MLVQIKGSDDVLFGEFYSKENKFWVHTPSFDYFKNEPCEKIEQIVEMIKSDIEVHFDCTAKHLDNFVFAMTPHN